MLKKRIVVKILAWSGMTLSLLMFLAVIPLSYIIGNMDMAWFISRYGPEGDESYRTYENLYEMSLSITDAANSRLLLFHFAIGIAFLFLGIILFLWSKDIKVTKSIP